MSIALMTLAWKMDISTAPKMVLLALCDNANDQGECYPSVAMLAEKCSMAERSVQKHISDMEAAGILARGYRTGRSTVYQINPRKLCTPANCAPHPRNWCTPTPAACAPYPRKWCTHNHQGTISRTIKETKAARRSRACVPADAGFARPGRC